MANNRIYLTCEKCGAGLFLGKTYGGGYFLDRYGGVDLESRLNIFYEDHQYCGENCFKIHYDHEEEQP